MVIGIGPKKLKMIMMSYRASLVLIFSVIPERSLWILTRHALLGHLPVIDLLLQGVVTHQAVDVAGFPLAVPVHPTHRLGVVAGVPGGVEHHHPVGADQVDAQAARSEGTTEHTCDEACRRVEGGAERGEREEPDLVESRKTQAALFSGSLN